MRFCGIAQDSEHSATWHGFLMSVFTGRNAIWPANRLQKWTKM